MLGTAYRRREFHRTLSLLPGCIHDLCWIANGDWRSGGGEFQHDCRVDICAV
jgi:hypothetical protein|tara:strand:- start:576 stop:731 length:156 start_codon:yes stop_codon:yes gene_type:complete